MNALAIVNKLPKTFMKFLGKASMKLSKNKPQIMLYGGVTVATIGFVWGIVAATKIHDTMAVEEAKMDAINSEKDNALNSTDNDVSEEEQKAIIVKCDKDIWKVRGETAWAMFKLMGIPCILFMGGMALSIGGHVVLLRRFGQLSTAFATLQQTFERYRQMNIAEHGEECDKRYRYGIVGESKAKVTVTDDQGNEKTINCKVPIIDSDKACSMYSFVFCPDTSSRCPRDAINTISYLKSQQEYWNMWMKGTQKPVTLYMVLNELGIEFDTDDPRKDYVMLAGWRPNGDGDNYIDFGIMRAINKPALTSGENFVWLNFNCDGNLYHSPRYTKDGKKVK